MRLLTVADQTLGGVRGEIDNFVTVLRTVEDPAAKSAQGKVALTAALEESERAVAAVSAAREAVAKGGDGAEAALATLDQTRDGVAALRAKVDELLQPRKVDPQTGEQVKRNVTPVTLQALVEETRGAVAVAKDRLRGLEGASDAAESKVFREIADETKGKQLADVKDEHVDQVTSAAAKLSANAGKFPMLESTGFNMMEQARAGKYTNLIGREFEVERLATVLRRGKKPNPMLLGDPGVGKTQIVEGLALKTVKGDVPEKLRDLQIWSITEADILAAAGGDQGAVEKLLKGIVTEVSEARARGENVVLFADELHTLLGNEKIANQLKPAMARGDISLIGATTWDEFNKHIAKDGAIVRRTATLSIEELSDEKVLAVLRDVQEGLSRHHDTIAMESAIQEIKRISDRYAKGRKQPDPAIELLDHALARTASTWSSQKPPGFLELSNDVGRMEASLPYFTRQAAIGDMKAGGMLASTTAKLDELRPKLDAMTTQLDEEIEVLTTRNDLVKDYLRLVDEGDQAAADAKMPELATANANVAALRQKYPDRLLNDMLDDVGVREAASDLYGRTISAGGAEEARKALQLKDELRKRVIGQETATDMIAKAMIGVKSGMKDPGQPAGAFLFRGPTGTGKTETWRATTEIMTGDTKNGVRIDMGEFSEPHSISKLFGSPPGYVGYDDSPALQALIQNPEAHVLFDEVEKAHPSIWQKLLPLFEEGRVTLGDGTVVDASGATLYMTTNLPDVATATKPGINDFFSPEFLNRLDGVVEFDKLEKEHVSTILDTLLLPKTLGRANENGLDVTISDAAKARIVDFGFDPEMGARPLKRSLKNHVNDPAGEMILKMRAAGRQVEEAVPQQATLDVASSGDGFVMRSADGELSVAIDARKASEHNPGAARRATAPVDLQRGNTRLEDESYEWAVDGNSSDDAAGAMRPPAPQAQPIMNGGGE